MARVTRPFQLQLLQTAELAHQIYSGKGRQYCTVECLWHHIHGGGCSKETGIIIAYTPYNAHSVLLLYLKGIRLRETTR